MANPEIIKKLYKKNEELNSVLEKVYEEGFKVDIGIDRKELAHETREYLNLLAYERFEK